MTAVESRHRPLTIPTSTTSRSKAVLHSVAHSRNPISLDEVMEVADLQTRQEKKYLLTPRQFKGTGSRSR